ncbi:hypothetical protein PV336_16330 [Streptomyces sp. MI02-2A]|uniref:hypothetical protein n=1 Tax=Streptomyces sp. MI02-2A TaxID=3028688 RepID=UPI0029BEA0D7|nr:hypothetical protein [Streptomyces sp. MI02-2A]MDX3260789.1 hypothetical protein [Streptomyces sp. MI02-2A]
MPNSLAVWRVLTQDVLGSQQRNGLTDTYIKMPTEDHDRVEEAAAAILERVAAAVNWDRLLMEAHWRHVELHPDKIEDRYQPTAPEVCGECLREALLSEEPYTPDWGKYPTTPLTRQKLDWPTVVSEELEHRSVATWHPYKD